MKLNYKDFGEGKPLVILHGLFGSLDNWQTLGKQFANFNRVVLVDQRNHGKSEHSDDFNYDLLADDLAELLEDLGIQKATLLGHSMGGKTIMQFAMRYPQMVDGLVVVDMGIKAYEPRHDVIIQGLEELEEGKFTSRNDAEEAIFPYIESPMVRQFLLKNLYWVNKEYLKLKFNLEGLKQSMEHILAPILGSSVDAPAIFIYGTNSDYVLEEDHEKIRSLFPKAEFMGLDSGHWVHYEAREEFFEEVRVFLHRHDL